MTARAKPDAFPFDSFRDAAPHLRRPFTPEAVKFKVQAVWPKEQPTGGLIVAYIDARLVVERLNLIIPDRWHDEYQPIGNQLMWCLLTVDGITRRDVGEGTGKGLVSDALKRAAVKFGVGVSLYAIPRMRLDAQSGSLKSKGATLELTEPGEKRVRSIYRRWLAEHGTRAFGDTLDHGDVEDPQGDPEAGETAVEPSTPGDNGQIDLADPDDVVRLREAAKGLPGSKLRTAFGAHGIDIPKFIDTHAFDRVPKAKVETLAQALAKIERPK